MTKKSISDIDVRGKRVLMRVDFNVPQDANGRIADDRRIRMALPTINHILNGGGRLVLMSHLGRPTGDGPEADARWTLAPIADRLEELLDKSVVFAEDCVGPPAESAVAALEDGECCLLENLRFHKAEQIKDKAAAQDEVQRRKKDAFAQGLASLADVYVNDAFGTCHRDNASMLTVPQIMADKPRVAGFLLEKELQYLGVALDAPKRPFLAIIGGKKVSDKMMVIESLLGKCDRVLIGGAMVYTFMRANGKETGASLVEEDRVEVAARLQSFGGEKLVLPTDVIAARAIEEGASFEVFQGMIPEGLMGLDIGPESAQRFSEMISEAKTIVWNGPMGVFEVKPFDGGTFTVAHALAEATKNGATTVIGGGDSAAAIEMAGLSEQVSHVSTGGGASLEFMEGKSFQAVEILDDL
ncbi:MAG: phosphoglycerate kinase [Nitrospinae bacterium]|nr:phosphoglycerate kinase [Nitrospinota bacterium]